MVETRICQVERRNRDAYLDLVSQDDTFSHRSANFFDTGRVKIDKADTSYAHIAVGDDTNSIHTLGRGIICFCRSERSQEVNGLEVTLV
jgi:hypothetical protein